jgi:sulfur carrier protein
MEIYINGNPRQLGEALTVAELLEQLGCAGRRVAVEVNCDIVPRSGYDTRVIQPGDKVEIVQAIGGG